MNTDADVWGRGREEVVSLCYAAAKALSEALGLLDEE